jgi:hypothetical protein
MTLRDARCRSGKAQCWTFAPNQLYGLGLHAARILRGRSEQRIGRRAET